MERDQIISKNNDFFNLEKECPENIPNCLELREKYKKDLEDIYDILTDKFGYTQTDFECCGDLKYVVVEKYLNIIANILTNNKFKFDSTFSKDESSYIYNNGQIRNNK